LGISGFCFVGDGGQAFTNGGRIAEHVCEKVSFESGDKSPHDFVGSWIVY
jgi:hypothetical protein